MVLNNFKADTKFGISVDPNRISTEGDQTHAVIAALIRFNSTKGETEVLLVDYRQASDSTTTTRLMAGSGEEGETILQTLERKVKYLSGLTVNTDSVFFLSERTPENSSKDISRQNEEHTKFGCLVTKWSGELITVKPVNGETQVPFWVNVHKIPRVFRNHKDHLDNALAYIRNNLKTDTEFTDL